MDREEKEVKEETAVPKTDPEMETAAAGENAAEAAEETAESGNQAETAQAQDGQAESQDGTEPEESTDDAGQKAEKKGFFKKKEKDQRDQKIEELTDQLRRNMAEFDNFRKRTEKEKSAMFEMGARDILEKILPVVDNFERGLAAIPGEEKESSFAKGMEMIYKQLIKTLEDAGVTPIEAVGKEFDPNLHNAVMHIDDENLGENVVAMELQKGYMYRSTVIRHSMVQVAN